MKNLKLSKKLKSDVQKEIVDSLPDKPHGSLILFPRAGKTKIAIDIIKKNNPKSILWVTVSPELAITEIPSEFEKWKAKKFIGRTKITTWASLRNIVGHYELIILDEEQFITESNSANLIDKTLTYDYIISMTGTESHRKEKQNIYGILELPILADYSINDAVEAGLLADYVINVVSIPLDDKPTLAAGTKKQPFKTSEKNLYRYLSGRVEHLRDVSPGSKVAMFATLARTRSIQRSPSKREYAKYLMDTLEGRTLSFSGSIETAEYVSSNTYHSKTTNKHLRQFITGEINSLSLVKAGGVGTTFLGIDNLIITQCDSDETGLTSQKISRTLLHQGDDYKATIWILCSKGTQDEVWVNKTLKRFDKDKIVRLELDEEFLNFKNGIKSRD